MKKPAAPKPNALHSISWAGMFLDPEDEPGLFALLPAWRQREVLFKRAEKAAGRTPTREQIDAATLSTPEVVVPDA